jgi:integrase
MRKKLTEAAVERLKPTPGKAQEYYFDTSLTGLVLCVGAKRKTWYCVFYENGKTKYHRLGHYPVLNRKQAGTKAKAFLGDPQAALKKEAAKESFKEVAENFLAQHVAKLRSKGEVTRVINRYLMKPLGNRAFTDLKRTDLVRVLNQIERDNGVRQRDMCLSILRKLMHWFEQEGGDDDYVTPARKLTARLSTTEQSRQRILDKHEIKALWNACEGTFGNFCKVALLTGQREAKVAHMRWDDLAGDTWVIRTEPREKSNPGRLRLPSLALSIINEQPRCVDNPYVFASQRGNGPIVSFADYKKKLDAKLPGMAPWVIHDLRRTARSLLSSLVLLHIAERVLGHAQRGMERVYDRHQYDKEKAWALQKLAQKIEAIVAGRDTEEDNVVMFPGGAA